MPENVIIQKNLPRENQLLFLGTEQLPGVQDVRMDFGPPVAPFNFLGAQSVRHMPQGERIGNVNISTLSISDDILLPFTGNTGTNGYILRERTNSVDNLSFISGYLTNYSASYSVSQPLQISATFSTYGNIGKLTSFPSHLQNDLNVIAGGQSNRILKIPGPGSISLSLSDFTTNRVLAYDLSISVPRKPIYSFGNSTPDRVEIIWPLEVNCNFDIEVNDYSATTINDFPVNPKNQNLTITVNAFDTNDPITTYQFNDLMLISESHSAAVNGVQMVRLGYQGFIAKV